jgi:hypothetical protein
VAADVYHLHVKRIYLVCYFCIVIEDLGKFLIGKKIDLRVGGGAWYFTKREDILSQVPVLWHGTDEGSF